MFYDVRGTLDGKLEINFWLQCCVLTVFLPYDQCKYNSYPIGKKKSH